LKLALKISFLVLSTLLCQSDTINAAIESYFDDIFVSVEAFIKMYVATQEPAKLNRARVSRLRELYK